MAEFERPETPPVLLIVFNRPEVTARVFEAVRQARPSRLYIAADGPRKGRAGEAERCAATRQAVAKVDWPCEVETLYRDANVGCRRAVSGAISWFFEHEPEGVILEDDCLPDPPFFPYCAELLARYRDDERVMLIAGDNTLPVMLDLDASYLFSAFPFIWGWASWRRAWRHYDFEQFRQADFERVIRSVNDAPAFVEKWRRWFSETARGEVDTWDFAWTFAVWAQSGLNCVPRRNLVRNIGFGADATHTLDAGSPRGATAPQRMALPLTHPQFVHRDAEFDALAIEHIFEIKPSPPGGIAARLKALRAALF